MVPFALDDAKLVSLTSDTSDRNLLNVLTDQHTTTADGAEVRLSDSGQHLSSGTDMSANIGTDGTTATLDGTLGSEGILGERRPSLPTSHATTTSESSVADPCRQQGPNSPRKPLPVNTSRELWLNRPTKSNLDKQPRSKATLVPVVPAKRSFDSSCKAKRTHDTDTTMTNLDIPISTFRKLPNQSQNPYILFEYAMVFLQQSPPKLEEGTSALFDLLNTITIINRPILHAMTHVALAIHAPFDPLGVCKHKFNHLEKASVILRDVLDDGTHGAACQGCLYLKFQTGSGMNFDENDQGQCNNIARLQAIIEAENLRLTYPEW